MERSPRESRVWCRENTVCTCLQTEILAFALELCEGGSHSRAEMSMVKAERTRGISQIVHRGGTGDWNCGYSEVKVLGKLPGLCIPDP